MCFQRNPGRYFKIGREWSYDVLVDDSIDTSAQNASWSVPFGNLSLTNYALGGDITVNETFIFDWQLGIQCTGGECVNENETLKVYPDPLTLGADWEVTE